MRKVSKTDELELAERDEYRHKFLVDGQLIFMDTPQNKVIKKTIESNYQRLVDMMNVRKHDQDDVHSIVSLIHETADLISQNSVQASYCVRGCAHCCKVPVSLTMVEADYINKMTRTKLKSEQPPLKTLTKAKHYCPFLCTSTASCSIHEYRPLECRAFFSMDSWENCIKTNNSHLILTSTSTEIGANMLGMLGHLSNQIAMQTRYSAYSDIRFWFGNGKRVDKAK